MGIKVKVIPKENLIIRESMRMAYNGGEIWFEQLDSLSIYKDIVTYKFLKDMETMKRPSYPAFLAINLNETLVDDEVAKVIVDGLIHIGRPILKVVFVGLDKPGVNLFKSELHKGKDLFVYTFMDDYEKAKEWLVQER